MNPKLDLVNLDLKVRLLSEGYPERLARFFARTTTFNLRHRVGFLKDKIAPGVYKDEFFSEFSRKELKHLIAAGFVAEQSFSPDGRGRRAAIIYSDFEMPQTVLHKKAIERAKKLPWATSLNLAFFFVAVFVLAFLFIHVKRSYGFSSAYPSKDEGLRGSIPDVPHGYFDDTGGAIGMDLARCYWLKRGDSVAISCVKR